MSSEDLMEDAKSVFSNKRGSHNDMAKNKKS